MVTNKIIEFFDISEQKVNGFESVDDKIKYIFDLYRRKVFFDGTKNFFNKRIFYAPEETLEVLEKGFGLHCQEMIFLLKEILLYFGIRGRVTHGDIYDFDLGIKKDRFISILIVDMGTYFFHIDTLHKALLKIEKGKAVKSEDGTLETLDIYEGYYVVKKYDGGINFYSEMIFKDVEERFRINRMEQTYNNSTVPWGIIAPFYWEVNPERKVLYNILQDKVRITYGRNVYDYDLLEWDISPESNWLNEKQKQKVNKCIAEIIQNIDTYMEVAKSAAPKVDSQISHETCLF